MTPEQERVLRACHAMCRAVCLFLVEQVRERERLAHQAQYTHYVADPAGPSVAVQRLVDALGDPL